MMPVQLKFEQHVCAITVFMYVDLHTGVSGCESLCTSTKLVKYFCESLFGAPVIATLGRGLIFGIRGMPLEFLVVFPYIKVWSAYKSNLTLHRAVYLKRRGPYLWAFQYVLKSSTFTKSFRALVFLQWGIVCCAWVIAYKLSFL